MNVRNQLSCKLLINIDLEILNHSEYSLEFIVFVIYIIDYWIAYFLGPLFYQLNVAFISIE